MLELDARARLQSDARQRCVGTAGCLQPGGRAHRKTRPNAEPHREGARREVRCPAELAYKQNGIGGPTVRLSLGRVAGRRTEHGHRTYRNTSPPFLQMGKRHHRGPWGPRRRSASRGKGTICSVCSAEIGNQPRTVYTTSRTPQQASP